MDLEYSPLLPSVLSMLLIILNEGEAFCVNMLIGIW